MKRFLSIILTFCLLLSLVTVSASAVTNAFGYGMEISGVEQNFSGSSLTPSGYTSYGPLTLFTWVPPADFDYENCEILAYRRSGSNNVFFWFYPSCSKYLYISDSLAICYDSSPADFVYYRPWLATSSSTNYQLNDMQYSDLTYHSAYETYYFYTSYSTNRTFDFLFSTCDIYVNGTLLVAGSDPVTIYDDSSFSNSFASADYSNLTVFKGSFSAVTQSISSDLSGNLALKYTLSDPYVDITYPASYWGISSTGEYNTLSISGKAAQSAAFGMQATLTDGTSYYGNTDLYFDSVQILLDGVAVTDQIDVNCNSPPASGIAVTDSGITYTDTSSVFDSSTTYSISPFESVTFRFYLKNPSGSSDATFSVSDAAFGECSVNAFANVTFTQLPAFVTSYVEPEEPDPEPSEDPDPGTSEDPDPGTSEDPDPEPSEDPDPEPSEDPNLAGDAISILGAIIPAAWELLSFEIPGLGVSCKVFVAAILLINLSIVIAHFAFGFGGSGTGYRSGSGGKKQISEKRKGDEK